VLTTRPGGATDAVEFGGGWGTRLLYGVSRNVYAGVSVAYFKNRKEYGYAVALPAPPTLGVWSPDGGPAMRELATLPIEALVQVRAPVAPSLTGTLAAGVGVTTTRAKVVVDGASRAAVERDVSIVFGAGCAWAVGRDLEVVGGLDFHQARSPGGEVWHRVAVPGYLAFTLGVRYPRF
jgi:hypothetical protein